MDYIGKGIYTYRDASIITGVGTGTLRRWTEGYKSAESRQSISPIFNGHSQ